VSKSNNITIPVTNDQDVSLLHDTSDDIETYPKQVKHCKLLITGSIVAVTSLTFKSSFPIGVEVCVINLSEKDGKLSCLTCFGYVSISSDVSCSKLTS
jgi:hypothetical protein